MNTDDIQASLDAFTERLVKRRKQRLYVGLVLILILVLLMGLLLLTGPAWDEDGVLPALGEQITQTDSAVARLQARHDSMLAQVAVRLDTTTRRLDDAAAELQATRAHVEAPLARVDGAVARAERRLGALAGSVGRQAARIDSLAAVPPLPIDSMHRALLERMAAIDARLATLEHRLDTLEYQYPRRTAVVLEGKTVAVPSLGFRISPGTLSGRALRGFTVSTLDDDTAVFTGTATLDDVTYFEYGGCRYVLQVRRAQKRLLWKDLLEIHIERAGCGD